MLAPKDTPMVPGDLVSRARYLREKMAREEAERLLEAKSRELFEANQILAQHAVTLEQEVAARTDELTKAKLAAEASTRAKSSFLATMSHEIRTPLNGIIGVADMLCNGLTDPDKRELARVILTSGESLLTILNDILDFSKIEADKLDLHTRSFCLRSVLTSVSGLHRIKASEKGVELLMDIDPRMETTREGDPDRIGQILHNLVGNALKFTAAGAVTVKLSRTAEDQVRIVVSDSGIGMTPEQVSRIFSRFEQADESTSRIYGGTGLGMSIVKRLTTMMGGEIIVRSTLGVGTNIELILPLPVTSDQPEAQVVSFELTSTPSRANLHIPGATPPRAGERQLPNLSRLRCLAADDHAMNRDILAALMAPTGLKLTLVADGHEAVETYMADPEAFDIVLLDISMPRVDGIEALKKIRLFERVAGARPTPAIALTANAMEEQLAEFRGAGFHSTVLKPFKSLTLSEMILDLCLDGKPV